LTAFLVDINPRDPATLLAVSVVLVVIGLLACLIPARRAMRVDPLVALRCESQNQAEGCKWLAL
jgi:ABC-type lipoprotein release transport system permease subunit